MITVENFITCIAITSINLKKQGLRAYCFHMYTVSAAIFFTMALESIFGPISVLLIALVQYLVPAEHIQIK